MRSCRRHRALRHVPRRAHRRRRLGGSRSRAPRPAAPCRARAGCTSMSSGSWSSGVACGIQPSPTRATRRSAGLPEPPIQIGGCGCCTGRGRCPTSAYFHRAPSCAAHSSASAPTIASIASSVIAPRSANGTPSASNSPSTWPAPTPTISAAARERVERRERLRGLRADAGTPRRTRWSSARVRVVCAARYAERRDRVEPLRRHHLGGLARDRDVVAHRDVEEPGVVARLRDARPCRRRVPSRAPTRIDTRTDSAWTGSWIP